MIGSFTYAESIERDCVAVVLSRGTGQQRLGRLVVPDDTLAMMAAKNYPSIDGELPLETALAYGLTIAMKANLRGIL